MDVQAELNAIAAEAARGDMVFPTHTELALRVQRALDDPNCTTEQLSKLIAAEPILSAKVVSVANSVAYNTSGRAITDVRTAVSRLGFNTLYSLATAVVVRQMRGMAQSKEHQAMAGRLWEHTAHVAALARVIAQRVTGQDPEAAFFAGIVHEVGGFYLISRAAQHPGLLEGDLELWYEGGEALVGRSILAALGVPSHVVAAIQNLWDGYLALPPQSLGDTLLLADQLAPVSSPLCGLPGAERTNADIDMQIDDQTLSSILAESAEAVNVLTAALKA